MTAVRRNLADPDYEPTDEDLVELSKEAFADLEERHRARMAALRHRIAEARAAARAEQAAAGAKR